VKGLSSKLPKPADIYAKLKDAYNADQGICDPSAIELPRDATDLLGKSCTVSFDCRSNDKGIDILKLLVDQLLPNFAKDDAYKTTQESRNDCIPNPTGPCVNMPSTYEYRTMPAITSLFATSIPQPDSGHFGSEIAHIRTTISCPEPESEMGICGVLGGLFTLASIAAPPAAAGGVLVQVGCGIAGQT
jgi:hypothetical protein